MQQDNKHIDKKLKELEDQSPSDLSHMEEHWQKMKTSLKPGDNAHIVAYTLNKWDFISLAAVIVCTIILYFINNTQQAHNISEKKDNTVTQSYSTPKEPNSTNNSVTIEPNSVSVPPYKIKSTSRQQRDKVTFHQQDTLPLTLLPDPKKDYSAQLESFFKPLEKKYQEFIIHSGSDTVIYAKEGTALMIPANAFRSKDSIRIIIKEFFSYEDMLTNRLTTSSNNKQLVTGGMFYITAYSNNKEISIELDKSIRLFLPDSSREMEKMELFNGEMIQPRSGMAAGVINEGLEDGNDTLAVFFRSNGINWIPENRQFISTYLNTTVKVLDLRDNPFKIRDKRNGDKIGYFTIDNFSKIDKETLAQLLKDKYGYTKVKIRKDKGPTWKRRSTVISQDLFSANNFAIGDSTWVNPTTAETYGLEITERRTYPQTRVGYSTQNLRTLFSDDNLNNLANRYSIDIRKLGWINCDYFFRDGRDKIDFVINLNDTASNYYSVLVFEKMRSIMPGYYSGDRVVFTNVPLGEKAKVVSIGIKDGKPVSAIRDVVLSRNEMNDLVFEETNPTAFKQQASTLDPQ